MFNKPAPALTQGYGVFFNLLTFNLSFFPCLLAFPDLYEVSDFLFIFYLYKVHNKHSGKRTITLYSRNFCCISIS
jgi:hypothetical protein